MNVYEKKDIKVMEKENAPWEKKKSTIPIDMM